MTAKGDMIDIGCEYVTNVSYADSISEEMLCAGAENKRGACQGDSGGPFTVKKDDQHSLVGIVSWGEGCGDVSQLFICRKIFHNSKLAC